MGTNEILDSAFRYQECGQMVEAIACYREAARLRPDLAAAHTGLAAILFRQKRYAEAERCCREALRIDSASAAGHSNLAAVLVQLRRFPEAEKSARQALQCDPGNTGAYNNLGNALREQDRFEEAESCFRHALEQAPGHAELRISLGNTLRAQLRLEEAREVYAGVLRDYPGHAAARLNRALGLLLAGEWKQGWEEYEARWQAGDSPARPFQQPLWDGAPLGGRSILLHAEQGLGDTVQFLRYVPLVQAGKQVFVECQPELAKLARSVSGLAGVIPAGGALPPFDVQAPLLSLPRIFRTTLESIPGRTPYVTPDPRRAAYWRARLGAETKRRIGLAWAGNPKHQSDRRRSLDPMLLAPLGNVSGVRLFSVQKGAPPPGLPVIDLAPELEDISDRAAVIENLDLVISVDTAVAHVAGALGKPVWTLLSYAADWRWLLKREDSPWYPSMRLFRQPEPGNWSAVIARVVTALEETAW
jgi:Flp pilus assembly protein TadD